MCLSQLVDCLHNLVRARTCRNFDRMIALLLANLLRHVERLEVKSLFVIFVEILLGHLLNKLLLQGFVLAVVRVSQVLGRHHYIVGLNFVL